MQQINLYQTILRKKQDPLSVRRLAIYSSALIVAMFLVSIAQWWGLSAGQNELASVKSEQQKLLKDIQILTTELATRGSDQGLKATLVSKEAEVANKKKVLQVLTGRRFGNTRGFANHFAGLARQRVEGLWVTGLHIHSGGEKINLQGGTLKPELVPRYLQNLAKEPSFDQIEFQSFLMERPEKATHIDFFLHSNKKDKS